MELRQLRYFLAAAEEENFNRAAARLNVAQPALSRQIANLEAELGLRLFDRVRRRVRLTRAGRAYAEEVRQVMRDLGRANEGVKRSPTRETGALRLAVHDPAARSVQVLELLNAFRESHPEVEVRLFVMTSADQRKSLRTGEIDAGFCYRATEQAADIDYVDLVTSDVVAALPPAHPLARKPTIMLRDLADERFVWCAHAQARGYYERLISAFHAGGVAPSVFQEATSEIAVLHLVCAGFGVGLVSDFECRHAPSELAIRRVADLSAPFHLSLISLRRDLTSAVQELKSFISEVAATPAPSQELTSPAH